MKNNIARFSLFLMLLLAIMVSNVEQSSAKTTLTPLYSVENITFYQEGVRPVCIAHHVAREEMDERTGDETLKLLYRLRDDVFSRSEYGRQLTDLFYKHTGRITYLLATNHQLRADAADLLIEFDDGISQVVGEKNRAVVSKETLNHLQTFLDELATLDRETSKDGDLASAIDIQSKQIEWDRLVGLSYTEAWKQVSQAKR